MIWKLVFIHRSFIYTKGVGENFIFPHYGEKVYIIKIKKQQLFTVKDIVYDYEENEVRVDIE